MKEKMGAEGGKKKGGGGVKNRDQNNGYKKKEHRVRPVNSPLTFCLKIKYLEK